VADGNSGDRSSVLDKDNPPITNSKPATLGALEPSDIARSFGRIASLLAMAALGMLILFAIMASRHLASPTNSYHRLGEKIGFAFEGGI
jgi:hypothetical protein